MAAPAGIERRGFAVGTFEIHDPVARIMRIGGGLHPVGLEHGGFDRIGRDCADSLPVIERMAQANRGGHRAQAAIGAEQTWTATGGLQRVVEQDDYPTAHAVTATPRRSHAPSGPDDSFKIAEKSPVARCPPFTGR
ncbi:hypothetical protein [uncultured Jannaschia sp.]|uniref:hypothetical protein n=1 Tax=uncultured Jannaschia sp. TaxID=293347 RepID=UPI00262DF8F1|nr:hypothetical protein [uncultured Jannaschia sp.]